MTIGIRNGTIVTPSDQYTSDILIDGERIAAIGSAPMRAGPAADSR